MPIISSSVSVAANAVSANVLAGEMFEFLPRTTVVVIYATMAATGLKATYSLGGEVQCDDVDFSIRASSPVVPDDLLLKTGGRAGERQVLKFRNTTGAPLVARWLVQIG